MSAGAGPLSWVSQHLLRAEHPWWLQLLASGLQAVAGGSLGIGASLGLGGAS